MLSAFKIPKKSFVASSFLKPVLPLLPETLPRTDKAHKAKYITMELKCQATGGRSSTGTYKKSIAYFEEGTPQEWIDTQRDILEVWTQNNVTTPADRIALVRAVLRGETLTTFEASIVDSRTQEDGTPAALTMEMVDKALTEVTTTIFPHHALHIQEQWMRKTMKKANKAYKHGS